MYLSGVGKLFFRSPRIKGRAGHANALRVVTICHPVAVSGKSSVSSEDARCCTNI